MKHRYIIIILLLLTTTIVSCRTQYMPLPEYHRRDSTHLSVYTRVDSIYEGHFRQEKQRDDTILIHDSVYIEKYRYLAKHDTVTLTHTDTISIAVPVEVPVDVPTPIPRFYVNCTLAFFLLILCIILYVFLRLYLHR